jgi:hypothetical protein
LFVFSDSLGPAKNPTPAPDAAYLMTAWIGE